MKLIQLLKGVNIIDKKIEITNDITCIENNSKKIIKGGCFVAIKGYKVDGHLYIKNAIERGARLIILDNKKYFDQDFENNGINYVLVDDSREALAILSNNFYGNPTSKLKLIGITGTNGKTSSASILNNMINYLGLKTGLFGTIENKIDDKVYKSSVTTPESHELGRMFSEMVDKKINYAIMEVSSHSLALNRVNALDYNVGIFTNLTEDHLDFHNSFEDYFSEKKKLFYLTTDGNVINIDDEYGERLYFELRENGVKSFSTSINKKADIMAQNIELNESGSSFDLITPIFSKRVNINLPGNIYIYNVMGAVGAMIALDFKADDITESLSRIKSVRGRLERVENKQNFNIIVDYAHTPDALEKVIEIAKEFTKGKVGVVFGCGGDRDKFKRPIMGTIASENADFVIVTSDNPRSENPLLIIDDIVEGITDINKSKVLLEPDRFLAIKKGIDKMDLNDTLLIAGKGHETYQILNDKTIDFDDREVVHNILGEVKKDDCRKY
ncbi:UDP-N-acetylmuramoyl-L-alanyl-D-glutamate--2,6-diaminopimelate ligase [Helicovermis profundi]|uniref:UDP-N-acetylmuramoyl-L-alanyl-D-glutamate--2,6-diaminopimelate ligase n=1 Tax=Helicovermis profundi TaxID=3065157 RepID=A0AAU9EC31_9FIRM|nr:UDP-N-acetylmuramoyl-L-alanyl-D-glutamate--2,6-diaminopimelate ligase [Clostridia bacterium S502]